MSVNMVLSAVMLLMLTLSCPVEALISSSISGSYSSLFKYRPFKQLSFAVPLHSLNDLAPVLPIDQVLEYTRIGHTCSRQLLTPEELIEWRMPIMEAYEKEYLNALRHEVRVFFGDKIYKKCRTVEQCRNALKKKSSEDITPFLQVFNLWRRHEALRRFILNKRVAHVAAQLLGVPRVRLYQDSLFVKRPGDNETLYHQDLATAPLDTNDFITAWIPLNPVPTVENGGCPLTFLSKSHFDHSKAYWWEPHSEEDECVLLQRYQSWDYAPLALGDVTFHHGWCLHGSQANQPHREARIALTLAYVSADARTIPSDTLFAPDPEDTCSYEDWYKDIGEGNVIDHPLTPLVWP